jgi:hypothetical protein
MQGRYEEQKGAIGACGLPNQLNSCPPPLPPASFHTLGIAQVSGKTTKAQIQAKQLTVLIHQRLFLYTLFNPRRQDDMPPLWLGRASQYLRIPIRIFVVHNDVRQARVLEVGRDPTAVG